MIKSFALIFCIITFSGCASSSGVVRIGQEIYMIARTEERFDGSSNNVKATVLKQANKYCESLGKIIKVVSTSQKDMIPFKSDATAEVQFMCLDANDPRLKLGINDPKLKKEADVVIETTEAVSVDVKTKEQSEKTKDVYTELLKLDDLRKKGIISDEEFETQKKKLLNEN